MGKCFSIKRKDIPRDHSLAECNSSINVKTIYSIKDFCGLGHFGTVNLAYSINDPSQVYAVKRISKEFIKNVGHLRREVDILCKLDHPNIIKIHETYQDLKFFYIVMDYCSGGTLYSKVSSGKLTEKKTAKIIQQIIEAVRYLQSKGICHRDIKPENFLFSSKHKSSKLVLIDFGLSHKTGKWFKTMAGLVGSIHYTAPEVIKGDYNEKCDNWSVGVIMYFLLSGSFPFQGDNEKQVIYNILNNGIPFHSHIWKNISIQARDLTQQLLCKNPEERISMEEAYHHPWFQQEFGEELLRGPVDDFKLYAQQEVLVISLTNILINTFSYKQIEDFFNSIIQMKNDTMNLIDFEKLVSIESGLDYGVSFSAKKIVKGALWGKLYLNEEKLWRAFSEFDIEKTGKIIIKELRMISTQLEGLNSRSFDTQPEQEITFDEIMKIYDNGKLLNK